MDKYIIAIDMDGTLLNSKNIVTEHSVSVLQKLARQGHYIVPASGRAVTLLPPELDRIPKRTWAITENGAMIWDYRKQRAIFREKMPEGTTAEILQQAQEYPCYAEVFSDGKAYIEAGDVSKILHAELGEEFIRYMLQNHSSVERLAWNLPLLEEAEKVNIYFEDMELSGKFRTGWENELSLAVTTSISGNIEFNRKGVNKGTALSKLRKMLGVDKDAVIAFGDNENDLEMFAEAGIAVAMENARKEIRSAASYVAGHHDRDGVACFLENFFKG